MYLPFIRAFGRETQLPLNEQLRRASNLVYLEILALSPSRIIMETLSATLACLLDTIIRINSE